MKPRAFLLLSAAFFLCSCANKFEHIPNPPQSITFSPNDTPEAALITLALERVLNGWYFKYELEEMRKHREAFVKDIRVHFHPDYPYGMGHPDDIEMDTTALPQLLPIRGFQSRIITDSTYRALLKANKTRSLLQVGNINVQGDSARVVIFVQATCVEMEVPSVCMAGGAIHYAFSRKANQWHFERIISHLQS